MSIVLGVDNARVIATLANRTFTYDLPLTNRDGRQIETYEIKRITHFTQNLDFTAPEEDILDTILGYRIAWDLSYNTFIDGEDVITMVSIMERHKAGYTLTLIPRIDQPQRRFTVIPDNQTLALGITAGGYDGFNTDWNFRFTTKSLVQSLQLEIAIDPASFTYGRVFSAGVLKGQLQ